jgi:hypothetical protein
MLVHILQERRELRFIELAILVGVIFLNDFFGGQRMKTRMAQPSGSGARRRRELDFAVSYILAKRGAFGLIEFAVFVHVVFIQNLFGQAFKPRTARAVWSGCAWWRRELDFSVSDVLAKGGQFVLVEAAVLVGVVSIQELLQQVFESGGTWGRAARRRTRCRVRVVGLGASRDAQQCDSERSDQGKFSWIVHNGSCLFLGCLSHPCGRSICSS